MNVVQEMYRNGSQGAWSWIEIRFLEILSHAYDCLSLKAHAAPSVGMHMASNTQHTRLMSKTSHDSLSPADPWPLPHKTAMEELWICKAVVHFWFEVAYGLVGKWSLWCHCHNCHLPPTWHNLTIRSPTGWVGKNDSHPLADPGRDGCLEAKQIEQLMRDLAYPGSIWGRELERTRDVVDFFRFPLWFSWILGRKLLLVDDCGSCCVPSLMKQGGPCLGIPCSLRPFGREPLWLARHHLLGKLRREDRMWELQWPSAGENWAPASFGSRSCDICQVTDIFFHPPKAPKPWWMLGVFNVRGMWFVAKTRWKI